MNKEDVIQNKNDAIKMMTDYLDNCLAINDDSSIKRVVSKQRIYDPKTEFDILSGIKLSNENLNLIDNKMKKMFIKN